MKIDIRARRRGREESEYKVITEPGGDGDGEPSTLLPKVDFNADEHPNRSRVQHRQLVYLFTLTNNEEWEMNGQPSVSMYYCQVLHLSKKKIPFTKKLHLVPEGAMEENRPQPDGHECLHKEGHPALLVRRQV